MRMMVHNFDCLTAFAMPTASPCTSRAPSRAWLGDNGEPLTVQKELMRHASIQTTLNTYGGGMMESMREAHGRVVKQAIAP